MSALDKTFKNIVKIANSFDKNYERAHPLDGGAFEINSSIEAYHLSDGYRELIVVCYDEIYLDQLIIKIKAYLENNPTSLRIYFSKAIKIGSRYKKILGVSIWI